MNNPYENALLQIKESIDLLWIEWKNLFERIKSPDRILEVSVPVKMDDWSIKTFKAYRSQHIDTLWPYKGWIRFHQDVNKDEVMALSVWMTIKTSVVGLPLWGWKGWIIVNPKELSSGELERLSRWFVQKIYKYIGPGVDVPAPDVNTNPSVMTHMMDEYSKLVWKYSPGSFTWKPLVNWGSEGRWEATANGWIIVLKNIFKLDGQSIEWKTVAIEWAWNAWLTAANILEKLWSKVVAISDSKWAIYNENWLNLDEIRNLKASRKSVTESKNWKIISDTELLELNVDILIPAALENTITKENAKNIKAKVILELANGPITKEADDILNKEWIIIIPDILANAWGVTVSYFEQVQNDSNYYWSAEEVESKLQEKMIKASSEVYYLAKKHNTNFRNAAYMIAIKRLNEALKNRWEI